MIEKNNNNLNNFSNLPDKIWDMACSFKTIDFNTKLEEKYNLSPKQIHILAGIEWAVFTKKISIQRFSKAIKEKLGLDKHVAEEISEKVNKNLFAPVENYLKKEKIKKLEPEETTKLKEKKEKQNIYKQKISPYEKERKIPKAKPVKISHKIEEKKALQPIPPLVNKQINYKEEETPEYKIRTMKKDVEKANKNPISVEPKPIPPNPPKKDNIVDLSNK